MKDKSRGIGKERKPEKKKDDMDDYLNSTEYKTWRQKRGKQDLSEEDEDDTA